MASILVLTTDLPFFPGKNGHDFFNLRYIANSHYVGVVAPRYETYPETGVNNLADSVDKLFLWPDPAPTTPLFISEQVQAKLPYLAHLLPQALRRRIIFNYLDIAKQPTGEAFDRLCILANCAPQMLAALQRHPWQAIVLLQSSLAPWLGFLPDWCAKIVYFHDVRSDYLSRSVDPDDVSQVDAVYSQELLACNRADAVGFVSELDLERATRLLPLPSVRIVSPIPIDTEYFFPRPATWIKTSRKCVLFTGHLGHPPNIDAVIYFINDVWPLVLHQSPDAVFHVVGLNPAPKLKAAVNSIPNIQLHANVPDIRPYFWNADLYVVPMRYGGGVRQKILEAWAMRVPVISTSMGAEGLPNPGGDLSWLADSPEAMASRICHVLSHGLEETLVASAESIVRTNHSIPKAAGCFKRLVENGIRARKKRPSRILYDLRWMEIGKAGGIEQMTYELVHAISRLDRFNKYRFYVPSSTYYDWDLDDAFHCDVHFSEPNAAKLDAWASTLINGLSDSVGFPSLLTPEMRTLRAWKRMDFELVHSFVGYIYPDLRSFPHIVTMHDLQHLAMPHFFSPNDLNVREQLYHESANKAAHIIAISEFTRQDIHRSYKIPLEKITTIWNIPSRNVWLPLRPQKRTAILRDLGIVGPFLFYPAHPWHHKNHARLIEAFNLILPHIDKSIKLVLSGKPFPQDHPALALIDKHKLRDRILHLGYRSPLEMRSLFHGALALVFPSLFEGFGMPVAEAIISGTPVACSRTTSLPEIAGDAAVTFDPENVHDIGGRLLEIINDPDRRNTLRAAAVRRRPLFSSRLNAIKTISLYQKVHEALYQS